jgi:hypothetical protein
VTVVLLQQVLLVVLVQEELRTWAGEPDHLDFKSDHQRQLLVVLEGRQYWVAVVEALLMLETGTQGETMAAAVVALRIMIMALLFTVVAQVHRGLLLLRSFINESTYFSKRNMR